MKTCTKCGEAKPLSAFSKKLNGLQSKCKTCCAAEHKSWREANRERLLAEAKATYRENRGDLLEKQKAYYQQHRTERLAYATGWRAKNPHKIRAEYVANAERYRARAKDWKRRNPDHQRMLEKARRAASRRIPAWANRPIMADIYRYAKIMRAAGVDCHVDHIVPLRGRNVCGLHVHDNLTVVLADENLRKGAKHYG